MSRDIASVLIASFKKHIFDPNAKFQTIMSFVKIFLSIIYFLFILTIISKLRDLLMRMHKIE